MISLLRCDDKYIEKASSVHGVNLSTKRWPRFDWFQQMKLFYTEHRDYCIRAGKLSQWIACNYSILSLTIPSWMSEISRPIDGLIGLYTVDSTVIAEAARSA